MKKERKKNRCIGMHEHMTCKNNYIMGKNPIQTTTLVSFKQAQNLECIKT